MVISVQLTGLDALVRTLVHDLDEAVQVPVLRKTLVAAAEPMRAGMAARAPRGADPAPHIAEHILTKPLSPSELEAVTDDSAGVELGPAKEFFYGYFWEFGGPNVRHPARPFMRPAFDAHQGEVLARIGSDLGAAILAAAAKETKR
jgi:hypothetical protein